MGATVLDDLDELLAENTGQKSEIERLTRDLNDARAESVRLRSYNEGQDKIVSDMEAKIERLRAALASLLEMPSACVRDDEVIENNRRRDEARKLIGASEQSTRSRALDELGKLDGETLEPSTRQDDFSPENDPFPTE